MADLTPLNFNPAEQEETEAFSIVPPGIHTVVIVGDTLKDNKEGTGKYLEIDCQIVDPGPNQGEVVKDRLNIKHSIEKVQAIGLTQLKRICDAVGFTGQLTNTSVLYGKPYSVQVTVEEFKSNKDGKVLQSNSIKKRMEKQVPEVQTKPPESQAGQSSASSW